MNRRRPPPRGFAMLLAVGLLALTAAAAVTLSEHFRSDFLRTRLADDDAQLRQLLLAGARDAVDRSKTWPATPAGTAWTMPLPECLKSDGAGVSLQPSATGDTAAVLILARIGSRQAAQTLHFRRSVEKWTIVDVTVPGGS